MHLGRCDAGEGKVHGDTALALLRIDKGKVTLENAVETRLGYQVGNQL